jgi:hypothetical protein
MRTDGMALRADVNDYADAHALAERWCPQLRAILGNEAKNLLSEPAGYRSDAIRRRCGGAHDRLRLDAGGAL